MTTIAYRNGVMAADSLCSLGNMRAGMVRKIAKGPDGQMGGCSGSAEACQKFIEWIERGEGDCPELGEGADGIYIDRDGRAFYVGPKAVFVPFTGEFTAVGSGEKFAMAAMHMGADAERAVEVAIALDICSGGKIEVIRR